MCTFISSSIHTPSTGHYDEHCALIAVISSYLWNSLVSVTNLLVNLIEIRSRVIA